MNQVNFNDFDLKCLQKGLYISPKLLIDISKLVCLIDIDFR